MRRIADAHGKPATHVLLNNPLSCTTHANDAYELFLTAAADDTVQFLQTLTSMTPWTPCHMDKQADHFYCAGQIVGLEKTWPMCEAVSQPREPHPWSRMRIQPLLAVHCDWLRRPSSFPVRCVIWQGLIHANNNLYKTLIFCKRERNIYCFRKSRFG